MDIILQIPVTAIVALVKDGAWKMISEKIISEGVRSNYKI